MSDLPMVHKCQHPPTIDVPPWTRSEMVLYGGTSWFYLFVTWYVLFDAWQVMANIKTDYAHSPVFAIYLSAAALWVGGVGMAYGLFRRPALRGWGWAMLVGLSAFGQILLFVCDVEAYRSRSVDLLLVLDDGSFAIWLAVGFFRSMFDALVETARRCPYQDESSVRGGLS